MPSNDSLRALLAIQQAGSITKAAKLEQKSASQLSHAISCLEDDLDLKLLSRDGYRATLTGQGEFIAAQSRHLLSELESIDLQIAGLAQTEPALKQLRLGFLEALPLAPYGNTLWQLQQHQPELCLQVERLHTAEITRQLGMGTLDFGIVFYHRNSQPNLTGRIIGQCEVVTVVSQDHPLASLEQAQNFDARTRYLQLSPTSYLGFGLDAMAQSSEYFWQVDSFELLVALLEQGLGWADVPRHWVEPLLRTGKLIQLKDIGNSTFWGHLQLIWHKDRQLSGIEHWLIDQLGSPRPGLAATCLPL